MLGFSYTKKETAIEEILYDFLKNRSRAEMSEDVCETYLTIGMTPKNLQIPNSEKPFLFQIIEKRVEHCFTFKFIDQRAILAVCLWAESAGNAIMYLWFIQAWCFKNNVKQIDFETLGTKIFPMGIFSKKDLSEVWKSQKVSPDGKNTIYETNLVDYNLAGSSIQFKN